MSDNVMKKRLTYMSQHRGTKEADMILGHFARQFLKTMTTEELDIFDNILSHNDTQLMAWIVCRSPLPIHNAKLTAQLKKIQASAHQLRQIQVF